jgi:hypothetical protein
VGGNKNRKLHNEKASNWAEVVREEISSFHRIWRTDLWVPREVHHIELGVIVRLLRTDHQYFRADGRVTTASRCRQTEPGFLSKRFTFKRKQFFPRNSPNLEKKIALTNYTRGYWYRRPAGTQVPEAGIGSLFKLACVVSLVRHMILQSAFGQAANSLRNRGKKR